MGKFKQFLVEKLSPSQGAEAYIHDFVHSDNPQFKGKSKKKRIDMALGAFYSAKEKVNEHKRLAGHAHSDLSVVPRQKLSKSRLGSKTTKNRYETKAEGAAAEKVKAREEQASRRVKPKSENEYAAEIYTQQRGSQPFHRQPSNPLKKKIKEAHEDVAQSAVAPAGKFVDAPTYKEMAYQKKGKPRTEKGTDLQLKWLKQRIKTK